jgi:hypothetical protein
LAVDPPIAIIQTQTILILAALPLLDDVGDMRASRTHRDRKIGLLGILGAEQEPFGCLLLEAENRVGGAPANEDDNNQSADHNWQTDFKGEFGHDFTLPGSLAY